MMIHYTKANTDAELHGILALQRQNLPSALTEDEIRSQGFVTVVHSFGDVKKLNQIEPHVIAKDGEQIIAYLLAMTAQSQLDIPVLQPMFKIFARVPFAGKTVADFHYLVVGQVCVHKAYRGRGILDNCYNYYRETFQKKYDFAVTEIDASNLRSLHAHARIGFRDVYRYSVLNGVEWVIVLWDWNNLSA
jgi:ribosomal protein S18 acetylase RimI-like enzyme